MWNFFPWTFERFDRGLEEQKLVTVSYGKIWWTARLSKHHKFIFMRALKRETESVKSRTKNVCVWETNTPHYSCVESYTLEEKKQLEIYFLFFTCCTCEDSESHKKRRLPSYIRGIYIIIIQRTAPSFEISYSTTMVRFEKHVRLQFCSYSRISSIYIYEYIVLLETQIIDTITLLKKNVSGRGPTVKHWKSIGLLYCWNNTCHLLFETIIAIIRR